MDDEIKNTRIKTGLNLSPNMAEQRSFFRSESRKERREGEGRGTPGRIRSLKFRKRPRAEIKPRLLPFKIHKLNVKALKAGIFLVYFSHREMSHAPRYTESCVEKKKCCFLSENGVRLFIVVSSGTRHLIERIDSEERGGEEKRREGARSANTLAPIMKF